MQIKKVLVANRGEIAIRVFRACVELNLKTVGIFTFEDRYSLHRYKADESYQVGGNEDPLKPYLDQDAIINIALEKGVQAIHPGYGFLSENASFARKCRENGLLFIGPDPEIMDQLGDKVKAKRIATACGVPIIQSNIEDLSNVAIAMEEAKRIGYPVILKAAAGGGGRGMRVLRSENDLATAFDSARREALNAFGDGTLFIEKYVEDPKHIEIQIAGDHHNNVIHLYERDCSVQRRFQKVVEVAPSIGIPETTRQALFKYATDIAKHVHYNNVGTVEFLVDKVWNPYFIEVNPRIQVEHTVTEMVTGIDIVKLQLHIASGTPVYSDITGIKSQESIALRGYAMQCRVTTEDPSNDFRPDYGVITTFRSAAGFGIRLDAGSLYQGVRISPFFDSMLVKVSAHAETLENACKKMHRALREFRIRGVKTNIPFLLNIIDHAKFRSGAYTVGFIQNHPELFKMKMQLDRGTKAVQFLGDIIVNGNPDVRFIDKDKKFSTPVVPPYEHFSSYPKGTKDMLTELGPDEFSKWLKNENKIHYTDTTMRDAHQSLLATRMRTIDMLAVAEAYAKKHPQTFSMEVWGGATFDVCLRFLHENPWERLASLRKAMPNILLQMLLRGSNAVGYTAYPDNLIEKFIEQAWETGIDVFRIFDSLNWMPALEPSINYVRNKTAGLAEVCLCYTGDILDPKKTKYTLAYYIQLAKDIENAGAHILAIKDMAGLLKPYAASELIGALKDHIDIPIHLHTHDTSAIQCATYLKAIEAGVDVVDVALGGLSGLTSQPNFNSIVEMMRFHDREQHFDQVSLNQFSTYWENVRELYYPFESGLKAGTAEVYAHEIPGGQYSNLKPQAIALGLGDQFENIKLMYRAVNEMFGDIVKVTPSSKVVGDMAQYMISNQLTPQNIIEQGEHISFPDSVKAFFRGDLGQPHGGFPAALQSVILKDEKPYSERPNAHLAPINFDVEFEAFLDTFQSGFPWSLQMTDFLSWKLYPKVWEGAYEKNKQYHDVSKIPTKNFFYGLEQNEETVFEIAPGKSILVELLSVGGANSDGYRTVFFKVNGQHRNVSILDKHLKVEKVYNKKVEKGHEGQYGAPLPGLLSKIMVKSGDKVKQNTPLFVIEAMKMENTIVAMEAGTVQTVQLSAGSLVDLDDLVVEIQE